MALLKQELDYLDKIDNQKKRNAHLKEFARTLAKQCRDENLSIGEIDLVVCILRSYVNDTTLRDGLTLE